MEDRSKLFAQIAVHLDYVARMDEEEPVRSARAGYIREVLIPFCEAEEGLKTEVEESMEFYQNR